MPAATPLRPDTLLHIYYLAGTIPAGRLPSGSHYLGNWEEDDFSFLFFTSPADEEVRAVVAGCGGCRLIDVYQMSYQQWQGGEITPLRVGRFLLNPPWISAAAEAGEIAITLDSGVVFGNGTHPTTQACLEAMAIACAGKTPDTVLDLGCGTGVLALAAAKLGCRRVLAVDNNFLAARTAWNNVRLNRLDGQILVINGRAEEQTAIVSDLLIANIHYDIMRQLVATEGFLHQKWFILSGLLTSQAEQLIATLHRLPVLILKEWHGDGIWHTILGITRESPSKSPNPATGGQP